MELISIIVELERIQVQEPHHVSRVYLVLIARKTGILSVFHALPVSFLQLVHQGARNAI